MRELPIGFLILMTASACGNNVKTAHAAAGVAAVATVAAAMAAAEKSSKSRPVAVLCIDDCHGQSCYETLDGSCASATALSGSSEQEYLMAAVVLAIAVPAQVVQTVRSQNAAPKSKSGKECCRTCPAGYFPCGDECRPQGCIPPCYEAPGCACYEWEDRSSRDRERPDAPPPPGPMPYIHP